MTAVETILATNFVVPKNFSLKISSDKISIFSILVEMVILGHFEQKTSRIFDITGINSNSFKNSKNSLFNSPPSK